MLACDVAGALRSLRLRAYTPIAIVLLVAAAAWWVAQHLVVATSITAFAVDDDDKRLGPWLSRLALAEPTRTMIITIGEASPEANAAAADELTAALVDDPEVESIRSGPDDTIGQALFEAVWSRRFRFLGDDAAVAARFSDEALAVAATRLRNELSRPSGAAIKRMAPRDPWLLGLDRMQQIRSAFAGDIAVEDGHFVTADRKWTVVLLTTRHGPFAAREQGPLDDTIETTLAALRTRHGVTIERTGLHRIAVTSERSIRAEVGVLSTASSLGVLLVLLLAFRRPRVLMLTMAPMVCGVVVASAVILAIRGEIHGLTLAFGTTLVGVCVDYPIHLATHHAVLRDRARALAASWPGLVLGATTTIAGFVAIAAFGLPGVRELAAFAAIGIAVALVVTRWLVAPWLPEASEGGAPRWQASIDRLAALASSKPRFLLAMVVAAGIAALGLVRTTWVDDPRVLGVATPEIVEEDARVRRRVTGSDVGRVLITVGRDLDEAVAIQAQVFDAIGGPTGRSSATLLPSRAQQDASLAAVRRLPDLAARTRRALVTAGFREEAFTSLDAEGLDDPGPLDHDALVAAGLDGLVRPFIVEAEDSVALLAFVPDADAAVLAEATATIPGASYLDQQAFIADVYREHRRQTLTAIAIGVLAVLGVLAIRYRNTKACIAAILPAVVAALASLGMQSWLGRPLNLLHLVGALLVLSMGVDYGVFLVENHRAGHVRGPAVTGVALACLTTVVAFGVLATSSTGALAAVGLTTSIGIAVAALLAPWSLLLLGARAPGDPNAP